MTGISEQARAVAFWVGCASTAGGLLLALIGDFVFAGAAIVVGVGVLYAIGAWHVPGTRRAYVAKVSEIWGEWTLNAEEATDRRWAAGAEYAGDRAIARLQRVRVPGSEREGHQRLIAALSAYVDAEQELYAARDAADTAAIAEAEAAVAETRAELEAATAG